MAEPNLRAAAGIGNTNPTADCGGCICNNDCSVSLAWNWYGMTKLHLYAALRTKQNILMSWVGHRPSHTWIPFLSRKPATTSNHSETTIMQLVLEAEANMHTVWSSLGGQPTRGQCFFHQWLLFTPPGTRHSEKGIKGMSKKAMLSCFQASAQVFVLSTFRRLLLLLFIYQFRGVCLPSNSSSNAVKSPVLRKKTSKIRSRIVLCD